MEPKIKHWLEKLPGEKRTNALLLRNILLSLSSEIEETIKWGNLTFTFGKSNIVFIYTYATVDYINLGFLFATSLSDPRHLFEGTGKGMRHIKIRTEKDIPTAQVKKWVKETLILLKSNINSS